MTTTDLKPGDIVQHPERRLNGLVVNGDGESIRILYLTSLGIVTTTSDLTGWERLESTPPADEQPTSATVTLPCPDCGEAITREVRPVRMAFSRTPKWSLEFMRSPGVVGERSHACQPDEPTEPGIRVAVCDMRLVSLMQSPTGGRLFADVKSGHVYDWDDLTQRGTVTIGWDE